jgi:hypothetical protein
LPDQLNAAICGDRSPRAFEGKPMPKMSDTDLQAILDAKIQNSLGYQGGRLAEQRRQAERYYKGEVFGNEIDGRSQVVSRDVAEAVDSMMPSLLRISDLSTELIFRSLSFGSSLEGLDATGFSLETLPFSLDSRAWTGGRLLLSAFDANHQLNYFTGPSLAPVVDTTEAELFPGGRAVVVNTRPIVDGGTPSVAIGTRDRNVDPVGFGASVAMDSLGNAPQRMAGRYHRARLTLPAGSSFTHIGGLDVDAVPAGTR